MKEELKVPRLRFEDKNGLPYSNWIKQSFESSFSFIQTNSFSRALLNDKKGSIKNIHYGDIHSKFKSNFDITKENVPYLNLDVDLTKIKHESYCREGDLIIADASEDYKDIGKAIQIINLNNEKLVSGLHTYIARPKNNIFYIGFPNYFFQSFSIRIQIMKIATGISVLGISKTNLNKITLQVPSLPEQEKIATFLTSVDKKIDQLSNKKSLLEKYKKAAMQKLFSQEIRFKKDNDESYPDWEEKKLEELFIERNESFNNSLPIYSLTIEKGIIPKSARYERSFLTKENYKYKTMKHNDFALNPMNLRFGALARHKDNLDVMVSKYYNIFYCKPNTNISFVELYLKSYNSIQFYNRMSTGSLEEKKRVHFKDFLKFKFSFPSLPEQEKIANFLTSIDNKIEQTTKQLDQAKTFKKGLLQQMFI